MSRLYDDVVLLGQDAADLDARARRLGIDLSVPMSNQEHAALVHQVIVQGGPWPTSWIELAERLHADAWLHCFIRKQPACRNAPDEARRVAIVYVVIQELLFAIIRNAAKWHEILVEEQRLLPQVQPLFDQAVNDLHGLEHQNKTQPSPDAAVRQKQIQDLVEHAQSLPQSWTDLGRQTQNPQSAIASWLAILGWPKTLNCLLPKIAHWVEHSECINWQGWIRLRVRDLARKCGRDELPPDEPRGRGGNPDGGMDFFAGLADLGREGSEWISNATTFEKPWVHVQVLTEAAPYGVAWLAVIRGTTREPPSRLGRRLIAMPRLQDTPHIRQAKILLSEVVGDFNGRDSTLQGFLLPADEDNAEDPDLFKFEEVRELLKLPEVKDDAELKACIERLLDRLGRDHFRWVTSGATHEQPT